MERTIAESIGACVLGNPQPKRSQDGSRAKREGVCVRTVDDTKIGRMIRDSRVNSG